MDTDVAEPQVAEADKAEQDHLTAADRLYRYSTWVHVGPGAQNCEAIDEEHGTNACSDPLHFHAWCRLPNPFQHREIREVALAAKARRARALRDPDTDANAILEGELDVLARQGDQVKVSLVEELLSKDWWRDWNEATEDIREKVYDGDEEPRYEHIEADQARFLEMEKVDPDLRPGEEYAQLEKHLGAYNEAVEARQKELEGPRKVALENLDVSALVDQIRDMRIDQEVTEQFMHAYSVNEWVRCTLRSVGGDPVWGDAGQMESAAPEVIVAIKDCFEDLEASQQQGGEAKNS